MEASLMTPDEKAIPKPDVLKKEIVYDGEGYTRQSIERMLVDYQRKHTVDLEKFGDLSKAYDRLSQEMTRDVSDQKSAIEYLSNIATFDEVGTNIKGLLHKIPIIRDLAPSRDLKELLSEKIEIAQRRVQEIGNYLDTLQSDIKNLQDEIVRLNKKMIVAAQNEEKAAAYVLELEAELKKLQEMLKAIPGQMTAETRALQAKVSDVRRLIYEHGARLRLYSNAEDRIAAIINMSNNFLEIMTNLNTSMTSLYEAGNEVLNELHGNLAGLASISKAGELSVEMHKSMESLKKSVNRLAVLASETSLYLTQNIDRLTAGMKVYDKETETLVASNLAAAREIKEQRIDETVALAKKEYGHFESARKPQ
jgi:DNA repair exonuclease SbcCD ATPase subunit